MRANINASVQYNANSLAFILAFIASSERATLHCDFLHTHSAPLPLRKRMLLSVLRLELKLTMEPAIIEISKIRIAVAIARSKRLEAINARISANELVLYCTLALILARTLFFAGKIKITLICNFL